MAASRGADSADQVSSENQNRITQGLVAGLRTFVANGKETDESVDFNGAFERVTQMGIQRDLIPIPSPHLLM